MARCPSCNRFVGIGLAEPEVDNLDADIPDLALPEEGVLTGEVRLVKTCAECDEELEEANLSIEEEFTLKHEGGCEGGGLTAEGDLVSSDRVEGAGRGAKTFYGAKGTVTVSCSCGAEVEVKVSVEEQASAFESLA